MVFYSTKRKRWFCLASNYLLLCYSMIQSDLKRKVDVITKHLSLCHPLPPVFMPSFVLTQLQSGRWSMQSLWEDVCEWNRRTEVQKPHSPKSTTGELCLHYVLVNWRKRLPLQLKYKEVITSVDQHLYFNLLELRCRDLQEQWNWCFFFFSVGNTEKPKRGTFKQNYFQMPSCTY